MSVINILPPHVADMIAAGEVVERPASVIKELMENSFDAGARALTVEIRDGGASYIRVSDDGVGMRAEDAGIAFLRHATSKLKDEHGLEAIGTMGFRGEALAAISAVSEIELYTRRRGEEEGCFLSVVAGEIQDMRPVGCPEGCSMSVSSLFFNTPARLKFLKTDRSEAAACIQTALRCALGRPEVSVRFIRDGREEFFSPGDGRADSALYSLLGRDLAVSMLPCLAEDGDMNVSGFVSSPAAGRGNRGAQYFYCNGRYIRSPLLQAAVEQAYKNTLLSGRYPACVLYLSLRWSAVDVNVHPAKTEVKFAEEKRVFDLVYNAALSALMGEKRFDMGNTDKPGKANEAKSPAANPAKQNSPAVNTAKAAPKGDFYRSMSSAEYLGTLKAAPKKPVDTQVQSVPGTLRAGTPSTPYSTGDSLPANTMPAPRKIEAKSPAAGEKSAFPVEKAVQNVESLPLPDHKIVGELMNTYIIVELKDECLLIDKHAAHERMNFDRLKRQDCRSLSQLLLCPVTLRLSETDRQLIEENAELFEELGFEIEPFGERDFILRAAPADLRPADCEAVIEEICQKLQRGASVSPSAMRDEILQTVACKAAIKAGWDTDRKELQKLVEAVISGEVKYCPHGRPVSISVTRKQLDKLFRRIV